MRAGPLIELPLAGMTAKAPVAERGAFSSFLCVSRRTVWTPHRPHPPRSACLYDAPLTYKLGRFLTEPYREVTLPALCENTHVVHRKAILAPMPRMKGCRE